MVTKLGPTVHPSQLVLALLGQVSGVQLPGAGKSISVYNQLPRSTQPDHRSVGRHNEYQPKGGDAWRLGSKGRCCLCVCGARGRLKLCDPVAITNYRPI